MIEKVRLFLSTKKVKIISFETQQKFIKFSKISSSERETYSESSQTSKTELSAKMVNSWKTSFWVLLQCVVIFFSDLCYFLAKYVCSCPSKKVFLKTSLNSPMSEVNTPTPESLFISRGKSRTFKEHLFCRAPLGDCYCSWNKPAKQKQR